MGLRFRKSLKLGPFRLTATGRGVGVSVGVKGARVGIGADGRVRETLSVPGTGLSYVDTHAMAPRAAVPEQVARSRGKLTPVGWLVAIVLGVLLAAWAAMVVGALVVRALQ